MNPIECTVGDLFEFVYGKGLTKKARNENGEFPVYGSNGEVGKHDKYLVDAPGIVVGRKGAAGEVSFAHNNFWPIDTTYFIKLNPEINTKYAYFLLKSLYLARLDKSTAIPGLNRNDAYAENVRFHCKPEQRAIVAKIEQLFSELDNGITNLKAAKAKLAIYRQAVLKKAFEGELTKEWREKQTDLPTADGLLEQIKKERARYHQKQLEAWTQHVKEWEENGRDGKKSGKPRKLPELVPLTKEELKELSDLPAGMTWTKLGNIVWSVKDGPHYSPEYSEAGIPFISGGNISPSGVEFSTAKFISEELHKELSKRCKPELNDILYTKGGTTGIARVNTYDIEFNVWVHVAVLKAVNSILPFYLQHLLNSSHCYRQSQKYTHGVGNQDLGLTRMILITLPICSLEEQTQIVQEIETRLSVCDNILRNIEEGLEKAEALRQSILKKAFEGKLLDETELAACRQQPDWEPADKLLARIRRDAMHRVSTTTTTTATTTTKTK